LLARTESFVTSYTYNIGDIVALGISRSLSTGTQASVNDNVSILNLLQAYISYKYGTQADVSIGKTLTVLPNVIYAFLDNVLLNLTNTFVADNLGLLYDNTVVNKAASFDSLDNIISYDNSQIDKTLLNIIDNNLLVNVVSNYIKTTGITTLIGKFITDALTLSDTRSLQIIDKRFTDTGVTLANNKTLTYVDIANMYNLVAIAELLGVTLIDNANVKEALQYNTTMGYTTQSTLILEQSLTFGNTKLVNIAYTLNVSHGLRFDRHLTQNAYSALSGAESLALMTSLLTANDSASVVNIISSYLTHVAVSPLYHVFGINAVTPKVRVAIIIHENRVLSIRENRNANIAYDNRTYVV
jgi:hypothetical protein